MDINKFFQYNVIYDSHGQMFFSTDSCTNNMQLIAQFEDSYLEGDGYDLANKLGNFIARAIVLKHFDYKFKLSPPNEVKEYLGQNIKYNPKNQGFYTVGGRNDDTCFMITRGWGSIQREFEDVGKAAAFQDSIALKIEEYVNSILNDSK